MKNKKVMAFLMALAMMVGTLAGCGSSNEGDASETKQDDSEVSAEEETEEEAEEEDKEVVNLKIYAYSLEQTDVDSVMEVLNEYTKEKIGVTVDYEFLGATYQDKMQVIIASGEEYDACFTSNWLNPYSSNVSKGAFLDITDMLPEIAPTLYESLPDMFWEAATINGGIYAIPNQQIVARQLSALIPKEYADAYEADTGKNALDCHTLTEFTDFGQYCVDNYGVKMGGLSFSDAAGYCGYEYVNDYLSAGVISMDDEEAKVVNLYETQEWLDTLNELYTLNQAGLLDGQNGYENDYSFSQRSAKKISVLLAGTYKPGVEAEESAFIGYDVAVGTAQDEAYVSTGNIVATMTAISATSKHPEETLKYLELLNTDPYVMNMVTYGIEGKHYEKVSDNVVKRIDDSGYTGVQSWAVGNVFNSYVVDGMPEDVWEKTEELNNNAKVSPLMGFTFDPEPVKMEIASVSKVVQEYQSLFSGELPVEETNTAFVDKLYLAGLEDVLAEMQSQIDAFLAAK